MSNNAQGKVASAPSLDVISGNVIPRDTPNYDGALFIDAPRNARSFQTLFERLGKLGDSTRKSAVGRIAEAVEERLDGIKEPDEVHEELDQLLRPWATICLWWTRKEQPFGELLGALRDERRALSSRPDVQEAIRLAKEADRQTQAWVEASRVSVSAPHGCVP